MTAGNFFILYKKEKDIVFTVFGGGEPNPNTNIYKYLEQAIYAAKEIRQYGYLAKVVNLDTHKEVFWNY